MMNKILIVEDEFSISNFMKTVLEGDGYTVEVATCAAQARAALEKMEFSAMLLDLGLPDADGLELLRELRQRYGLPVIVVSARTEESEKVAALDSGADDYITKPFGSPELLARIRAALRRAGPAANLSAFTTGELTIDYDKHLVTLAGQPVHLAVEHPRLWSPDDPYLYDLTVTLVRDGRVIDRAESYAALREIATGRDANGIERMTLNGRPLFHFGPLDQGWWPDGLYTAPTDEALLYDIRFTKQLGFNMIRKHIKVEPERWYWHCDREGILVWQDMPSGDMSTGKWEPHRYGAGTDAARSEESFANYYKEWGEIMDFCGRHPSVVVWVPYNEAWGQYRAEEVADWTKRRDPSRLVNPASGGNYRDCGDMLDLHNYPEPKMYLYDAKRVNVLGEYGGIGLPVEGHLWSADKNWGYIEFKTREDVTDRYVTYAEKLMELVERGFSAAVYTQTTDVEGEVNGLVTYDREVVKVDVDRLHEVNRRLVRSLDL